MEIIGNRTYVEIPGERTHELPPLLVRGSPEIAPLGEVVDLAAGIVEDEDLVPHLAADAWARESALEKRKFG